MWLQSNEISSDGSNKGGVEAAKSLLDTDECSQGLTFLYEARRLDISMEALILEPQWSTLFTKEELDIAKNRLDELGYYKK